MIIQEWDLNTGFIQRSYANHTGQLSSICYRPSSTVLLYPAPSPPKPQITAVYDGRRRGSLGSNNSLESLFGDGSPNGTMNEGLMDPVIDNDQPTTTQETVTDEAVSEKETCRDVFLTSSIDGAISLWDRRQDRMVARLAAGSRGAPPWCMSVFPFFFGLSYFRHVGQRMEIGFMLVDETALLMSIRCINLQVLLLEIFDFLEIQDLSHLSPQCQMAEI